MILKNKITAFLVTFFFTSVCFGATSTTDKRIAELKTEITQIAKQATAKIKYQNEFSPETRRQLDPLVRELVSISKAISVQEQLIRSVGSWKSLWSDLPFTTAVADQIYQVVFPTGYYYNISKYETPTGIWTSFLRGAYTLQSTNLEIIFTKAVKNPDFYAQGTDIYRLAMQAELGVFDGVLDEQNQPGLNRPGTLNTLFIDEDLRIVGGQLRENGVPDSLFVLERRGTIQ